MFNYEEDKLSSLTVAGALVVVSVCGLLTNGVLLYGLPKLSEKSMSFQLIRMIGVTDLSLGVCTLMVCISRFGLDLAAAYTSWFYCPVFGSLTFFFSGTSSILMSFLALERYCVICHQRGLPRRLTITIFIVIASTFAILLAGSSILGSYAPDPTFLFCFPEGSTWSTFSNYAFYLVINVPVAVLVFCYVSIFVKCCRMSIPNQVDSVTKKAAIQSLLLLVVYFICYMPKFLTTVIGIFYGLSAPPRILYLLIPIGMTLLVVVNPILVLFLHRQMKRVVIQLVFGDKHLIRLQ
ncbi:hypothetical protein L0F63_005947, partial [Massospora cicadina]